MKPESILTSLLLILTFTSGELHAVRPPSLIPAPLRMELEGAQFAIDSDTRISSPEPWLAEQLADVWEKRTGIALTSIPEGGAIVLSLSREDAPKLGDEGYRIRITPERAVVTAAHRNGLFYGTVTLRQLLAKNDDGTWFLPCGEIDDSPRFGWRGLMLDPARTFMAVEEVRRFVDVMAFYKLNVLHLHLTDGQGWRFESKLFPQLTEKASTFGERFKQPPEFSGFYTQQELKDLVRYAARRGISILPEIEMPGHSRAMLVVFPEFSSVAKPFPPYMVPAFMGDQVKGLQRDGVNPANLEFDAFIDKIFAEVAEVFPFPYLHIGGDEMQFEIWMKNPKIVNYMKEKGLKGPHELQAHFIARMDRLVQKNGRTMIAWDEVLNGGAPKDAVIMSWRGRAAVEKALKSGARIVATPNNDLYLQRPQGPPDPSQKLKPGHARNPKSYNTLRKMYVYDPCAGLDETQSKQVMGIQGCIWMAIAKSVPDVQVMVFPRLIAIAESAWTQPAKKDYADFYRRMLPQNSHLDRFGMLYWKDAKGINAPDSGYSVSAPKKPKATKKPKAAPKP